MSVSKAGPCPSPQATLKFHCLPMKQQISVPQSWQNIGTSRLAWFHEQCSPWLPMLQIHDLWACCPAKGDVALPQINTKTGFFMYWSLSGNNKISCSLTVPHGDHACKVQWIIPIRISITITKSLHRSKYLVLFFSFRLTHFKEQCFEWESTFT